MNREPADELLTVGQAAERFDVKDWQIQRVLARGMVPFSRVGNLRVVNVRHVQQLKAALTLAGYLDVPAGV